MSPTLSPSSDSNAAAGTSAPPSPRPLATPKPVSDLLEVHPEWGFIPGGTGEDAQSVAIQGITVASDDVAPGWAFVGIPGRTRHGAQFASAAQRGGAALLVTDQAGASLASGLPVLVTQDPRAAAGDIASWLHSADHAPLAKVAVTGTNGKTTTTYFVRSALEPAYGRAALLGTIEVDTIASRSHAERTTHEAPVVHRALAEAAQAGATAAVVEVSSHAMSLQRVRGIEFDAAIFTNLQHDHLDFYDGSMEQYFRAKQMLFQPGVSKQAIIAVDDDYGRRLARDTTIPATAVQVLTDDDPQLRAVPLWRVRSIASDPRNGGSTFELVDPEGASHQAQCPLPGRANVQDAALALVTAVKLGVSLDSAVLSLAQSPPVPGRMHWVQRPGGRTPAVIVDSGHTPEAIELAIETLLPFTSGRLIAVFGTDGDRDATKRAPLARVFAKKADVLWVTDENPRTEDPVAIRRQLMDAVKEIRPDLRGVTEVSTSRRDAIREAMLAAEPGDLVLIAGKGSERYQEWSGVKHYFYDPDVAAEVIRDGSWDAPAQ